jgi:hypothetical protein
VTADTVAEGRIVYRREQRNLGLHQGVSSMSRNVYSHHKELGIEAAVSIRRFVNDEVARVGSRFDWNGREYEFVCECGDLSCDGSVKMTLSDYRASRPGSVVGHT